VNETEWLVDADHDPIVFTSYGRAPAVELRVPASYGRQEAVTALADVAELSRALPANGRACTGARTPPPATSKGTAGASG
jgi:hypothetical protein